MTHPGRGGALRRAGAVLGVAALLSGTGLAGCGGEPDPETRAAEARAYATAVAELTERTRADLASTSEAADYRDAEAAAESTRAYATAILEAADALEAAADVPAVVAAEHRQLIGLYRDTAARMLALAERFASADGADELAERAQELSSEVQRLASQEQALRSSIDRALATPAAGGSTPPPAN